MKNLDSRFHRTCIALRATRLVFALGLAASLPASVAFTQEKNTSVTPGSAALSSPATAANTTPPHPGVTEYMGRNVAQTMHYTGAAWLIRTKRDREEAATLMRSKLELKPGMTVCDLGCGNGYHTFPMAREVAPSGKVYGVEIQEPYLKMLEEAAKKQEVTNFVPVLGLLHDPQLPDNTFDLILLVDVYHEFSHPVEMLAAMRKALKPDGKLVLVEFRAEDESVPIKPEHKMSKAQINKELNANGYTCVKEFDELPWQHMMWFGKTGDGVSSPAK
jgi:ubiquinone/menaquinone biosynthesis C-methylase UbiE